MLGKAGWSLSSLLLDGRRRIDIVRRFRGDLPDWLACAADLNSLTVAETRVVPIKRSPGDGRRPSAST